MAFPEGSRKIAFMAFCQSHRNFARTRALIKGHKSFQGRVPSMRTLRAWVEDGHWNVLADMVDDGILDVLEMEKDPDIREAIKDDATFFRIMMRLRSQLVVMVSKKNSPLMPRNSGDTVRFMKFLQEQIETYSTRAASADSRRVGAKAEEVPDNVTNMAKFLQGEGIPATKSNVARALLRSKNS